MKTPVLIAAYNEEACIGATLSSLPKEARPIVVANGCADGTADIARGFGAEVIELEEPAKTASLQAGMARLGRQAAEGFIILDADTRPVFPEAWLNQMQQRLGETTCRMVCGTSIYRGEHGKAAAALRSARNYAKVIKANITSSDYMPGINLGIRPNQAALEGLLELPGTLWPGEDQAMRDVIVAANGDYQVSPDPRLLTLTSARGHTSISDRLLKGRQWGLDYAKSWHVSKAPAGSISYEEWKEQQPGPQTD